MNDAVELVRIRLDWITAMSMFNEIFNLTRKLIETEEHRTNVVWVSKDLCKTKSSDAISAGLVEDLVGMLITKCNELLEILSLGIVLEDFDFKNFNEDLNNITAGISFLDLNNLKEHGAAVCKKVPTNNYKVLNGKFIFTPQFTLWYFATTKHLNQLMVNLVHLSSGAPSRGTEVVEYMYSNSK